MASSGGTHRRSRYGRSIYRHAGELQRPNRPLRTGGLQAQIPPRDPRAGPELIDRAEAYTASLSSIFAGIPGHNLSALIDGLQVLDHTTFDIRGVVRLASRGKIAPQTPMDRGTIRLVSNGEISGVPISRKAQRLQFLSKPAWGITPAPSRRNDRWQLHHHFANGKQEEIAIINGERHRPLVRWQAGPCRTGLDGHKSR